MELKCEYNSMEGLATAAVTLAFRQENLESAQQVAPGSPAAEGAGLRRRAAGEAPGLSPLSLKVSGKDFSVSYTKTG